jgi:hypothetical protein
MYSVADLLVVVSNLLVTPILRCANTQRRDARTMRNGIKRLALQGSGINPKSSSAISRGLARHRRIVSSPKWSFGVIGARDYVARSGRESHVPQAACARALWPQPRGKARLDEGKKTSVAFPASASRLGRPTPTPAENLGRRGYAGRWRGSFVFHDLLQRTKRLVRQLTHVGDDLVRLNSGGPFRPTAAIAARTSLPRG